MLLPGVGYYRTPLAQRPFAEGHELRKPSGLLGHGLGVVGTGLIVIGVAGYLARKRLTVLARLGKLRHWLSVHIFLCTLGPFLVLVHTSFKFSGLVAISFWSMVAVVVSGVFGRYVYVRVPKTVNGRYLSIRTLEEENSRLLARLSGSRQAWASDLFRQIAPPRPRSRGVLSALITTIRLDMTRGRRVRKAERLLTARQVSPSVRKPLIALFRRRLQLEHQIALLAPLQRLLRYWHLFHLPLTIVMFAILAVHVTVAILFGYAWVLR